MTIRKTKVNETVLSSVLKEHWGEDGGNKLTGDDKFVALGVPSDDKGADAIDGVIDFDRHLNMYGSPDPKITPEKMHQFGFKPKGTDAIDMTTVNTGCVAIPDEELAHLEVAYIDEYDVPSQLLIDVLNATNDRVGQGYDITGATAGDIEAELMRQIEEQRKGRQ